MKKKNEKSSIMPILCTSMVFITAYAVVTTYMLINNVELSRTYPSYDEAILQSKSIIANDKGKRYAKN